MVARQGKPFSCSLNHTAMDTSLIEFEDESLEIRLGLPTILEIPDWSFDTVGL